MDTKKQLDLHHKLLKQLRETCFGWEPVTLATGKRSDFYFDLKPAMLHPLGAARLAELIAREFRGLRLDCVGGPVIGAVPLLSPIVMKCREAGHLLQGFFIRKQPKAYGRRRLIEGADIAGMTVAILDDLTTTGTSAMQAVETAKAAGAEVALVLSIVDRGEGAIAVFRSAGIPFKSLFSVEEFLTPLR